MKKTIGVIVNPVAGMGGSVGLKGTDGEDIYEKALELGALPVTPGRTEDLLQNIKELDYIELITAPGKMGEDIVQSQNIPYQVVGSINEKTSESDTIAISKEMIARGIELLIFVGGDGTARNILDAVGSKIPVVAVPSGVKVFSAVFATSTRAAAEMVDAFIAGTGTTEEEVLDIDEDAYRDNRLSSKLYGYLTVPDVKRFLQAGKSASDTTISVAENKEDIAAYFVMTMADDTLYLIGPGTTTKAITDEMGLEKTLLGIDAVHAGNVIAKDINEKGILELLEQYPERKIVVTPLGGNGFIFGRGSKQFTPQVIQKIGVKNTIVVANKDKVLQIKCLRVDTGDYELDKALSGYREVLVGYREKSMVKVEC